MSTILTLSSFGIVVSLILITISFTELLPPKWSFDIPVIVLIISCIGLAVGAGIEKRQIKNNSGIYQMKQNTSKLNKETIMENKISIQRALTTIKLFEKNFNIRNSFESATVASKGVTNNGTTENEFTTEFNKNFESVIDKIDHITKLRMLIQTSNMEHKLNVPQLGELSIAEVISYRQSTLPKIRQVVETLAEQYNTTVRKFEQAHQKWVSDFNDAIAKSKDGESGDFHLALIEELKKREPKIIFDKSVYNKYKELVEYFENELDIILSEHNAATFIYLK